MISANTIVGGRYRVVRPLGGGGMKQVYLAEDLRLSARPCALAEMVDGFTNPDMQRQAVSGFQREADMLAELSHEHIPRIYDRFSDQNRHYLVMEYVDGSTLENQIAAAGGKLGAEHVVDVSLQVLDTLIYLHGLQPAVIYRDLKPSNVMFTSAGLVKLVDFGIARHFQPHSNATMIGTQGYAPPEQYRGKVEARSDLYALGATMHHALSGRDPALEPPFSFPPLRNLCPNISAALAELIDSALAYDVERRPPSSIEFKRRLLSIKIEALTGGLVTNMQAAEAIAQAHSTGKPQLNLPLGGAGASRATGSNAPTVVMASNDAPCPRCRKRIPPDSRFCSYCAADLRTHLGPAQLASPDDRTVVLSEAAMEPELRPRPAVTYRHRRRSPGRMRIRWIMIALIVAGAGAARVASYIGRLENPDPGAPAIPPSARVVPSLPPFGPDDPLAPDSGEIESLSLRSQLLRQSLDSQGYRDVRFRLSEDSAELSGTVRTQADRLIVEAMAYTVGGAVQINDHIQIQHD